MKGTFASAVAALILVIPGAALAADSATMVPIRQFISAFNKGDLKAAEAAHTADVIIVDEPAPFLWKGPGAFKAWVADLERDEKARDRTDGAVTLGQTRREEVAGDAAYVIVDADYAFKDKGAPMHEPSQMTYRLTKTSEGWKISSWTWTGPRAQPRK